MADRQSARTLTRLFGWGRRADKAPADPGSAEAAAGDKLVSTKAFGRFVRALSTRESPVLLDLGPIVGANVNFLGERLGCKYVVEDVYANIEAHVKTKNPPDLAEFFRTRFPQPDASFDGILCWDVLDYLDKASAQEVARQLVRLLKPGGALFGFFSTVASPATEYNRFIVVDEGTIRQRPYPASRPRQQVIANRDINRLFEGLSVSDSFLLLTKTREIVFRKPDRKPAEKAATGSNAGAKGEPSKGGTPGAA